MSTWALAIWETGRDVAHCQYPNTIAIRPSTALPRYPARMPSATFTETVEINATPGEVWDRLQEPSIWQSVGPVQKVWDPTIENGVLQTFKWSTNIGGKEYKGDGKALDHTRPGHYKLLLDTSEMSGTISVDLTPGNPGGTNAVVAMELKSKGMLSSMFFPAIKKAVGSGFPQQIADMVTELSD